MKLPGTALDSLETLLENLGVSLKHTEIPRNIPGKLLNSPCMSRKSPGTSLSPYGKHWNPLKPLDHFLERTWNPWKIHGTSLKPPETEWDAFHLLECYFSTLSPPERPWNCLECHCPWDPMKLLNHSWKIPWNAPETTWNVFETPLKSPETT